MFHNARKTNKSTFSLHVVGENFVGFFHNCFKAQIIPPSPSLPSFSPLSAVPSLLFLPPTSVPSLSLTPSTVPFSHLLSSPPSLYSSNHLCPRGSCSALIWCVEMSAMWGDRDGPARQPVKLLGHCGPGDWLTGRLSERQKVSAGLASNGSIHSPQQPHSLEFYFCLFSQSHSVFFLCFSL